MNNIKRLIIFPLLGLLALNGASLQAAQECDPSIQALTPTERFEDMQDGTVKDTLTGLLWQRCVIGQIWDGKTCQDAPRKQVTSWFSWSDANHEVNRLQQFPEFRDWRLPRLIELKSIIDVRCTKPAINLAVFPNSPPSYFWTSDELQSNREYVWRVDFKDGKQGNDLKTNFSYYIRLVKSDKPSELSDLQQKNQDMDAWDDGVHDISNPYLTMLQPKDEATKGLPKTSRKLIDWAKALTIEKINPRYSVDGQQTKMEIYDGDILYTDTYVMPHVLFPHKIHTMWLACENCHDKIFEKKKNAVNIAMADVFSGKYCGVCHGKVAFSPKSCERCHSVPHEGSIKLGL